MIFFSIEYMSNGKESNDGVGWKLLRKAWQEQTIIFSRHHLQTQLSGFEQCDAGHLSFLGKVPAQSLFINQYGNTQFQQTKCFFSLVYVFSLQEPLLPPTHTHTRTHAHTHTTTVVSSVRPRLPFQWVIEHDSAQQMPKSHISLPTFASSCRGFAHRKRGPPASPNLVSFLPPLNTDIKDAITALYYTTLTFDVFEVKNIMEAKSCAW